jgi:predicted enzyme related to lactoylglutathione lyase
MPDYPHGTPSWVELNTADPAAAASFYGALFGWRASMPGPAEETGGYQMFDQGGKNVAGLMKTMQAGQPTAWATYVSVDSADATVAAVTEAGGSVMVAPMDVMDIGRMAILTDPAGAVFGIWEPKTFTGADLVNKPNSLCWNEVLTRDAAATLDFYPKVFGWSAVAPGFDGAGDYKVWQRADGNQVGGCMQMTDEWFPPQVPSHWAVTFAVADTDALVVKVPELGGKVTMPAMDCPIGRFAGFIDPQGASFAVMTLASQP